MTDTSELLGQAAAKEGTARGSWARFWRQAGTQVRGQLLLRAQVLPSLCSQGMLLLSIGCLCSRGIFYTQIPSLDKNRVARDTRHRCSHCSPGGSCQEPLVGEQDGHLLRANPYASVPLSIMACCSCSQTPHSHLLGLISAHLQPAAQMIPSVYS